MLILKLEIDKFHPGKILMTSGVNERSTNDENFVMFVNDSIKRHLNCDWGDMDQEDKESNDLGLNKECPDRLFSSYIFNNNEHDKIWIITEYSREYTTILFPSEY